ncbi:hypothetical protein QBC41DRAFT_366329 [Cercophora samala]|uniref:Zn(2)-C6 fungal-type domain-containing protein n=1 Tax=Cercophora samala TaxID=330535 RepID=A0AA40D9V7_9PEZI|nr:hypothetical protein QBC41DRAFT_366329 [Cercophora samala]
MGPHITDTYRLRIVTAGHFRTVYTPHRLTLIMPNPDHGNPSVDSPSPAPVSNDNATTTTTTTPRAASPKGPRRRAPNRTVDGGPPACVKCHGFKMRCIRQPNQTDCNRCINAKIECVPREPGSVGRPRLPRPPGWKRSHYKKGRRLGGQPLQSTSPAADLESESSSPEAPPPESTSPARSSAPARYGGPLIGLAGYNALLPNFDDLPRDSPAAAAHPRGSIYTESTFRAPEPPQAPLHPLLRQLQASTQPQPSPQPPQQQQQQQPTPRPPPNQDPIEQLTRLQLEIYQHHNLAKKTEPSARKELPSGGAEREPLDTSWIKPLFQSASLFLTILSSFPPSSPPDTATFLMIISIYTRLLQTFEALANCIQGYVWYHHHVGSVLEPDDEEFQHGLDRTVAVTIGGVEVPQGVGGVRVEAGVVAQQGVLTLMEKIGGLLGRLVVMVGEDMVVERGALEGVRKLEGRVRAGLRYEKWSG